MNVKFFINQHNSKLAPLTLYRGANSLLCGGFTLTELLEDIQYPKDIKIASTVIPSISNLEKIQKGDFDKLSIFKYPWDFITKNKIILTENLRYRINNQNFHKLQEGVYIGESVKIASSVQFEADEQHPVVINNYSQISHFTYIEGPTYIGTNTKVIDHTSLKRVTIGNTCKVGGEIEDSVISDFTNKQHYGYIGNSYIGEWVNLGAGTTNSDLKNTYGEIKIGYQNQKINTGEKFLGCIIGDFSKTAINTTIYTGKIIGLNSHIFGCVYKNIPSFINFVESFSDGNQEFGLDKSLQIQGRMFKRRDIEQTDINIKKLTDCFEATQVERNNFLNFYHDKNN